MAVVGEITLSGFGSYGPKPQTLRLGGQGPVAIVGDNGVGKSTAVSKGLTWCLYGKCPPERMGSGTRAISGRSVVGTGQKRAVVTVTIQAETATFTIKRERARSGSDVIEVQRDGEPQSNATQATIDGIVGADYDTFCRTVVRGQGDPWSFAEATDARKREILDAISGAEELEAAWIVAKQKRVEAEAAVKAAERTRSGVEGELTRIDIASTRRQLDAWNVSMQAKIKAAEEEVADLRQKFDAATAADRQIGDNREKRDKLLNAKPTLDLTPYEAAISDAATYYREAFARYQTATRDVQRLASLSIGDPCPTCEQPIGEIVLNKLVEAQSEQNASQAAVVSTEAEENNCKTIKVQAEQWLTREVEEWQRAVLEVPNQTPEAPALGREIKQAERRLLDMREVENPYQSRLEAELMREAMLTRELRIASVAVQQARWVVEAAAAWQEALGPKGARAHMAESALAAVEAAANRWLAVLSERGLTVEFPPTREVKGRVKEEIKTVVHIEDNGEHTSRDLLTFSGGERRRINLAVDLGVAAACGGGGLSLSLLVLDEEVFSGMDDSGKAAVVSALHEAGVADVVIIDHDPRLSSTLPRTIKITRGRKGYSNMEEVTT